MAYQLLPLLTILVIASVSVYGVHSAEDVTTTVPTPTQVPVKGQSADLQAKRKAEQAQRKKISNGYQSTYFKMCSETFNKLKTLTEQCSKELNMDSDVIKACVKRRMERRNKPKGKPGKRRKGSKNDRRKNKNDSDVELVNSVDTFTKGTTTSSPDVKDIEPTTSTTTTVAPVAEEKEVVIGDNAEPPTTSVVITDEVMQAAKEEETSWRTIWRLESHTVGCYIDQMRKNDSKFKSMKRMEWREEKGKLTLEQLKIKQKCLNDKLDASN